MARAASQQQQQHARDSTNSSGASATSATASPARKVAWRVYRDPDNPLATSTGSQAFWSAFATLTLAITGSSTLSTAYAISRVGVAAGLLTMAVVALCNDYTTSLLISAAYATGVDSFEGLAHWAGGGRLRAFTQFVLITLLWAPNSGGLSLMADAAQDAARQVQEILTLASSGGSGAAAAPPAAPAPAAAAAAAAVGRSGISAWALTSREWLLACLADGQSWMVLLTLAVVLPLSCRRHMRALETAGAAGLVLMLLLLAVLAYGAVTNGMPAIASGELRVWSLQLSRQLPEAFSLLGYAFSCQPQVMPLIREMPEGRTGRSALTSAVHSALLGSSLFLYASLGFFGAAWFGRDTESNILLNALTTHPVAGLVLNAAMLFYLAAGAAACQYPLRTSIDVLLVGEHVPMTTPRAVLINAVTLGVSLAVALATPGGAESVYALVGASGVCIICYVLPVVIHLRVMHARRRQACLQLAAKASAGDDGSGGGADEAAGGGTVVRISAAGSGGDDDDGLAVPLLTPSSPHSSVSSLTDVSGLPLRGVLLPVRVAAPGLLKPLLLTPGRPAWLDISLRWLCPLVVMCLGVAFSVASLSVAIRDVWRP